MVTQLPSRTPRSPTSTPTPPPATTGLLDTLIAYKPGQTYDPEGSKAQAFATLQDFVNSLGPYRGAWWFQDDGQADIYEALAVVFYTEGHASEAVRKAVAARYLWYCGGEATSCSGSQLMNFLAYFQAWREPKFQGSNFTNPAAQSYLDLAQDVVHQESGLLTAWIPGADKWVHAAGALETVYPVNWADTPFHFANVHPSWDRHLRQTLRRGPDGANRLWVLTMREAEQVCPSRFVCDYMTAERAQ